MSKQADADSADKLMANTPSCPSLGVGVSWTPGIEPLLEPGSGLADLVEVEPQTFWDFPGSDRLFHMKEKIVNTVKAFGKPVIVHGVGAPVATVSRATPEFLRSFAESVSGFAAPWASEHLSFSMVRDEEREYFAGMTLPQLQTEAGVRATAQTIREIRGYLSVPFAFETPVNYLKSRCGNLSDGEFLSRVAEEADCGILLDFNNIWVNEKNGRQPVREFLDALPLDRVWEVHVAKGLQYRDYWLDAHDGLVSDEVMALAESVMPRLPNLKALIYEIQPYFIREIGIPKLQRQMESLQALWRKCRPASPSPGAAATAPALPVDASPPPAWDHGVSPEAWEKTLGELVALGDSQGLLSEELRDDPGLPILRTLTAGFRSGKIVDAMGMTAQLLIAYRGFAFLESQLNEHYRSSPPAFFPRDEAKAFAAFLRRGGLPIPYLRSILAFDEAKIAVLETNRPQEVRFECDPNELLPRIGNGELPEGLPQGEFILEITP